MAQIAALLAQQWPDAIVELDHQNAYQLLVATILSAQSTDRMINTITPALFERYPDARALAAADPGEVEKLIFKSGFFRQKTKSLLGMARTLVEKHGGEVPQTMEELVKVPGVGRKTANVVLGNALGKQEGIVVDTHVARVSQRLGLTKETDPVKIEQDLMKVVPRDQWAMFANRLIWHGRRICDAKMPDHEHCILAPLCPSAGLVTLGMAKKAAKKPGGEPVARAPAKASAKPAAKSFAKPSAKPAARSSAKLAAKSSAKLAAKASGKPAGKAPAKPIAKHHAKAAAALAQPARKSAKAQPSRGAR